MEARARLLGHPIHQMLVPIPFGLLATAALLDVVSSFVRIPAITIVSFWNVVLGVVSALFVAIFGTIDWTKIPKGSRARRVGVVHAIANLLVVGLFVFAILVRRDEPFFAPPTMARRPRMPRSTPTP